MQSKEPLNYSPFPLDKDFLLTNVEKESIFIAAIDIGTNSTHLLVSLINPTLNTFSIELAEKVTTRLGERDPLSGDLTDEAMDRVLETLRNFKEIARSYGVKAIITAATSAVREAPNGKQFIENIKITLGLNIDLITGLEEARLIYLGVLSGMRFDRKSYLILDIGGGSTELILADNEDARALTSTKIGAVRLQREFINKEPIPDQKIEFLKAYIQGSLEQAVEKINSRIKMDETTSLIATSGTAMAIGNLIAHEESKGIKLQGYIFSKTQLDNIIQKLISMNLEQRKKLTSLNDRRAEIIIPGALILQTTMKLLNKQNIILSERALREGLIVDWMIRNGFLEDRFSYQKDIRQRTVIHQVERFSVDKKRAQNVANHAITLYESTKDILHNDTGQGRDLLWAAAMLHSCGRHISSSSYHKHSWYLIRNGELLGYSHSEHLIIAAIARYHRKSLPKKRHEAWQTITDREDRLLVMKMSLLLRLASAIDRRPDPIVLDLQVQLVESEVRIALKPRSIQQDLSLEKWSLMSCRDSIKETTGFDLVLE